MESISMDGGDLLASLRTHPDYQHLNDPDFFVDYPVMHSPLALPGMSRAVSYLEEALANGEGMLLVGDRDVDGVTSAALLQRFLLHRSGQSDSIFTLVSSEGDDYGLAGHFLERIHNSPAGLIILMDMGSAHLDEIRGLLSAGKKVIVIDHHVISDPENLPDCAFINPRLLPYCESLEHEGKIATVGLVYKLIIAFALYHTGLWNRIEILRQLNGHYHIFRSGAYLHSSTDPERSIFPQEVARTLPMSMADAHELPASGIQEILAACKQWPASDLILNGISELSPEVVFISESDLVDASRMQQSPWLDCEEGRLRAGQYLFAASVMQRPRLLEFLVEHSDLAAIGLVTDMVPLRGENRVVARLGMRLNTLLGKVIPEPDFRPGLGSLYSALRIDRSDWSGRDFGWKIGPVLNAAGRMGETELALELLTSSSAEEASGLARKLVRLNERRKDRTRKNQSIIEELLEKHPEKAEAPLLVCFDDRLEPGVSGILASRLMERYRRPVVYMNPDGERIRGSVRSFGGLSALSILEGVGHLLLQYGGHPEAAGFSLERESLDLLEPALLERMEDVLEQSGWRGEDHQVRPGVLVDIDISRLNRRLYEEMEMLEPFGPGNPEPVFRIPEARISQVKFLSSGLHAQITFRGSSTLRGVLWNRGSLIHSLILASGGESAGTGTIEGLDLPVKEVMGTLEADAFRGGKKRSRFQFVIQDLSSPLLEDAAAREQPRKATKLATVQEVPSADSLFLN